MFRPSLYASSPPTTRQYTDIRPRTLQAQDAHRIFQQHGGGVAYSPEQHNLEVKSTPLMADALMEPHGEVERLMVSHNLTASDLFHIAQSVEEQRQREAFAFAREPNVAPSHLRVDLPPSLEESDTIDTMEQSFSMSIPPDDIVMAMSSPTIVGTADPFGLSGTRPSSRPACSSTKHSSRPDCDIILSHAPSPLACSLDCVAIAPICSSSNLVHTTGDSSLVAPCPLLDAQRHMEARSICCDHVVARTSHSQPDTLSAAAATTPTVTTSTAALSSSSSCTATLTPVPIVLSTTTTTTTPMTTSTATHTALTFASTAARSYLGPKSPSRSLPHANDSHSRTQPLISTPTTQLRSSFNLPPPPPPPPPPLPSPPRRYSFPGRSFTPPCTSSVTQFPSDSTRRCRSAHLLPIRRPVWIESEGDADCDTDELTEVKLNHNTSEPEEESMIERSVSQMDAPADDEDDDNGVDYDDDPLEEVDIIVLEHKRQSVSPTIHCVPHGDALNPMTPMVLPGGNAAVTDAKLKHDVGHGDTEVVLVQDQPLPSNAPVEDIQSIVGTDPPPSYSWGDIPPPVLWDVFSRMSSSQVTVAAMVCRQWFDMSCVSALWRHLFRKEIGEELYQDIQSRGGCHSWKMAFILLKWRWFDLSKGLSLCKHRGVVRGTQYIVDSGIMLSPRQTRALRSYFRDRSGGSCWSSREAAQVCVQLLVNPSNSASALPTSGTLGCIGGDAIVDELEPPTTGIIDSLNSTNAALHHHDVSWNDYWKYTESVLCGNATDVHRIADRVASISVTRAERGDAGITRPPLHPVAFDWGPDIDIRCALVGDSACGKTSMTTVYTRMEFPGEYTPTVCDNYSCRVKANNVCCTLSLVDLSGADEHNALRPYSYSLNDVFLVCYSVVEPGSLENVKNKWIPEIRASVPTGRIVLVGCKIDLRHDGLVLERLEVAGHRPPLLYDEGVVFAHQVGAVCYVECSSLTGSGVKNVFDQVFLSMIEGHIKTKAKRSGSLLSRLSKRLL
eukprot:TRINITY_DN5691_c0_g1_i1.p1 TRINITY_DN5691_c0_g1~~TRINITY_DN5691_c0_g1_i1.p1  ORF type:complete len:1010 (+),score=115.90 TRINITY_DN5691_c0_g1_i1:111-3140(+)